MCGILGVVSQAPVNQLLYDGLQVLQHRGQDAAGIVTAHGNIFYMHKGSGMVRDVFRTRNMRSLLGTARLPHIPNWIRKRESSLHLDGTCLNHPLFLAKWESMAKLAI